MCIEQTVPSVGWLAGWLFNVQATHRRISQNVLFTNMHVLTLLLLLSAASTTWGVAGRKRRSCVARQNAWAGGMLYRDSLFDSVNPDLPWASSSFAATECCVIWVLNWQSCGCTCYHTEKEVAGHSFYFATVPTLTLRRQVPCRVPQEYLLLSWPC